MSIDYPKLIIQLPKWVTTFLPPLDTVYSTLEERMNLVIDLARQNIQHKTGGPFGAGIFDMNTHQLLAPGVNLVISANCSILHAEMVAIALAQQRVDDFDLSAAGDYELVSSTEPCAMCMGAVPWSGARRLVCGARDEDARNFGFDEGAKLKDWISALNHRGIEVVQNVCRDSAVQVLCDYKKQGGVIYNSQILEKNS